MKKFQWLVFAIGIPFFMAGCGSSSTRSSYDVYYLTDDMGNGIENIAYTCDSGEEGYTDSHGAFGFDVAGDSCLFDLAGESEDLYIMDEFSGINGLEYLCSPSGISGVTGDFFGDGSFDYEVDDICRIDL